MNSQALIIQKIVAVAKTLHAIKSIMLFGSRARGDYDKRSDIDLAVIVPDITDQEWLEIVAAITGIDTLLQLDIVRFDTASRPLQQRILQEGKVIYEQDKNKTVSI